MKNSEESLHNQNKNRNNLNYWSPKRRKKGDGSERLFKERIAENSPYLCRDLDIQVHEAYQSSHKFEFKDIFSKTHYNKTVKKQKNLKSSRRKEAGSFQRNP